jgi:hypothetical protein
MDILCHRCGEPWDTDTFHDVAEELGITWQKAVARFRKMGCEGIPGERRCEATYRNGPAIAALGEMLGDDVDGFAAMCEDFAL